MDRTKNPIKEASVLKASGTEEANRESALDFSQLYRENAQRVFYYLYSRVRNVADAEDLTSQTFMAALENLSRLHEPYKFTPWVFTIARNKATDFFRQSQRHPLTDYQEELIQTSIGDDGMTPTDRERLRDLAALIDQLNPHDQEYLRLRIAADLPFAEIASILNQPEARVKKKYYRLLARLQAQMEK